MIPKLKGREKVQVHLIANKVNQLIQIITELRVDIVVLKNKLKGGLEK